MFKPHPEEFFPADFEAAAAESGVPFSDCDFQIIEGPDGHDLVVANAKGPVPSPKPTPVPPTTQE